MEKINTPYKYSIRRLQNCDINSSLDHYQSNLKPKQPMVNILTCHMTAFRRQISITGPVLDLICRS